MAYFQYNSGSNQGGGCGLSGTDSPGMKEEQIKALFDITPQEIKELDADTRFHMIMAYKEHESRKSENFWNAVQAFATGAIPILAFLGISSFYRKK